MIVVITSIQLKSPLKFFALSYNAMKIVKQLKKTLCVAYKSIGFWTMHYTKSLWKTKEEMKDFARSGAHLNAMKKSACTAREIQTLVVEVSPLPIWKEAKKWLRSEGKVLRF